MNNLWKVEHRLQGGVNFLSNDVRSDNPGWGESQLINIENMSFIFENNFNGHIKYMKVYFEGMRQYNFFIEAQAYANQGMKHIMGIWFMGHLPHKDEVVGCVIRPAIVKPFVVPFGKEYEGQAVGCWKQGVPNSPRFFIEEVKHGH